MHQGPSRGGGDRTLVLQHLLSVPGFACLFRAGKGDLTCCWAFTLRRGRYGFRHSTKRSMPIRSAGNHSNGASVALKGKQGRGDIGNLHHSFLGWPEPWCQPFRDLLSHLPTDVNPGDGGWAVCERTCTFPNPLTSPCPSSWTQVCLHGHPLSIRCLQPIQPSLEFGRRIWTCESP